MVFYIIHQLAERDALVEGWREGRGNRNKFCAFGQGKILSWPISPFQVTLYNKYGALELEDLAWDNVYKGTPRRNCLEWVSLPPHSHNHCIKRRNKGSCHQWLLSNRKTGPYMLTQHNLQEGMLPGWDQGKRRSPSHLKSHGGQEKPLVSWKGEISLLFLVKRTQ